jgi:hypothetical protein
MIMVHPSGLTMKDDGSDSGRVAEKAAKGSREARLKLALRENLKRRKSQARERGDFTPASPGSADVARDRAEKNPDK